VTRPKRAKRPSKLFAEQLAAVRGRKGWTQHQLAERLRTLGVPLDRGALSKIEAEIRGVSLDEAIALAAALEVSPLSLFAPRRRDEKVAVTPKVYNAQIGAVVRDWVRGSTPLDYSDERFFYDQVADDEWKAYEHSEIRQLVKLVAGLVREAGDQDVDAMRSTLDGISIESEHLRRRLGTEA
jgi:transcriptional regulator with XRE-family HTH domain